MEHVQQYSLQELAKRNGRIMPEIWVGYKGKIYDVTASELFKGGKHYFHESGCDLTAEMGDAPHVEDVMEKFPVVGVLVQEGDTAPAMETPQDSGVTDSNEKKKTGKYTGKVIKIVRRSERVKSFFIKFNGNFSFTPGQYMQFDLDLPQGRAKRFYSIASLPQNDVVEFVIEQKQGGLVSGFLFDSVKSGDNLQISGPYGKFTVPDSGYNDYCFICTDVGIGPIRAQIIDLLKKGRRGNVYLIYGNRYEQDILFHEQWQLLSQLYPSFHYYPVLSRETGPGWQGRKGYVHPVYQELFADKPGVCFLVCGWKPMVEQAKSNLEQMRAGKIMTELYV